MNAAERPCLLHRVLALAAALLLLGGLFLSPALGLHAQAEEISSTQKLRVGYYAYTGFNMIDADGSYSGYSYELLQKIARYRNVIYEYDGYDDVKACLEAGMNSHVGKPLDMQVLAAEICRQVRRYTALLESADFTKLGN